MSETVKVAASKNGKEAKEVLKEVVEQVVEQVEEDDNDPRRVIAHLQNKLIFVEDQLARVLAEPLVHATVVDASNELNRDKFKKGDYVIIIDENNKKLYGHSGKLVQDGWDDSGQVVVMLPNLDKHRFAVGIGDDEPQIKLVGKNDGRNVTLAVDGGQLYEVNGLPGYEFTPGMIVKVNLGSKQIIEVEGLVGPGQTAHVCNVIDAENVEVESEGGNRVVLVGDLSVPMEVGDRVMLDRTGTIILKHLGKVDEGRYHIEDLDKISWDDIGGCEEAKEAMIETVELPFKHPDIYQFYNRPLPKGVLLSGPPGCGKTLVAKAAANSIAKTFGQDVMKSQFFNIKGPELLSKYVGHTEQMIREIFHRARRATKKSGHPSFVCIDEAEAILPMRGTGVSSDVNKTIVPMFLAEMDGLSESKVICILLTNRQGMLDPAVVRHGRIDRHIKVHRPDEKSAARIFNIHLKGIPLFDVDAMTAAAYVTSDLFSTSRTLYNITVKGGTKSHVFSLRHAVNGAMIRGVIDTASDFALRRDLKSNVKKGVTVEDFGRAVESIYKQQQSLEHQFDMEDYLDCHNLPRCEVNVEKTKSVD